MASERSVDEQKKRTLEALERRFAQAEAEVRLQQQKCKKRPREEKDRITNSIIYTSKDALASPPLKAPTKRGNISFSGRATKEDLEANDHVYCQLSHCVDENLLRDGGVCLMQISNRRSAVDHILHELFQHGDSAEKYMQGSRNMKIENWVLLDNFVQKSRISASKFRALQTHSKRSKKHMSLKEQKRCGIFHLPKELHNFELFKPMHEMWKSYITQLLKNVGKNQLAQSLLNADLHGALVLVVQCKIQAYSGIHGILIRETAETFAIITEDNKLRVVPKKLSSFMLQADCWRITLLGDKLSSRTLAP